MRLAAIGCRGVVERALGVDARQEHGGRGGPRIEIALDERARLQVIAWALLTLQILSGVIGSIARSISTPAHPIDIDAGFSLTGWLAVLLTFLLARVFAAGTLMRDDLEGTV